MRRVRSKRPPRKNLTAISLEVPPGIREGSFTARFIQLHGLLQRLPAEEELRRRVLNNCRVMMLARGINSYTDLAKKIGVVKPTISMFFSRQTGRQQVMLFVRIMAVLGVSDPLDLFTADLVQEGVGRFEGSR